MPKARKFGQDVEGTVCFHCPGCDCLHVIPVSNEKRNANVWAFNNSFETPTFSPSILIKTGSYAVPTYEDGEIKPVICHSFVTNGMIQYLSDSTHELSGKTVDLPELDEHFDALD